MVRRPTVQLFQTVQVLYVTVSSFQNGPDGSDADKSETNGFTLDLNQRLRLAQRPEIYFQHQHPTRLTAQ